MSTLLCFNLVRKPYTHSAAYSLAMPAALIVTPAAQTEVALEPIARERASVLQNLFELYVHDFSEQVPLQLQESGRFELSPGEVWWTRDATSPTGPGPSSAGRHSPPPSVRSLSRASSGVCCWSDGGRFQRPPAQGETAGARFCAWIASQIASTLSRLSPEP
jgi:hypothetical protein